MSNITLTQTAEKPITVATDEAINSFVDSRQGRLEACREGFLAISFCRRKNIVPLPIPLDAPGLVAAGLSGDTAARMR
jgi:hypothetical protein